MRRVPHGLYASLFGVVHLILTTNVLLVIGCLPLVLLLITTDPVRSWPLLSAAVPLCAPAVRGAFAVFGAYGRGESRIVRSFWGAWRRGFGRSFAVATAATVIATIALIDIRFLSTSQVGVVVIPLLLIVVVLVVGAAPVTLVALVEAPGAALLRTLRISLVLATRRWYFTLASLLVVAFQAYLFTLSPALALGVSAAPTLYLVWAGARYTLLPALPADQPVAA